VTPLTAVIIPAFIGVAATLLTIFLTPALQHYFWMLKRREELRLGVIDDINRLLSDYITKHIDCTHRGERYDPPVSFFESLRVVDTKLRVLFSDDTFKAYKQAEVMIAHGGLGPGGTIEKFVAAQEATLRAMYGEVGLLQGAVANLRRWGRLSRGRR
jgi:hypothetical protein